MIRDPNSGLFYKVPDGLSQSLTGSHFVLSGASPHHEISVKLLGLDQPVDTDPTNPATIKVTKDLVTRTIVPQLEAYGPFESRRHRQALIMTRCARGVIEGADSEQVAIAALFPRAIALVSYRTLLKDYQDESVQNFLGLQALQFLESLDTGAGAAAPHVANGQNSTEHAVFLSHNSLDKPKVRVLAQQLKETGVSYWLDEEHIPKGVSFISALESGLENSNIVLLILGDNGMGPWHKLEYEAALTLHVKNKLKLIPFALTEKAAWPLFANPLDGFIGFDKLDEVVATCKLACTDE